MKIIFNILISLVSISVQQSNAYYSSASICTSLFTSDPKNCSSGNNLANGLICCTITDGIKTACSPTPTIYSLFIVTNSKYDIQCWNNYPNITMRNSTNSCFSAKPKITSDCTSLSANGVACCLNTKNNLKSCFAIYSNQTKYIQNNNFMNSPNDSVTFDCGTYGNYSLPTNTPHYGNSTDTPNNGNGGMILFNFLILILIILLV